MTDRSDGLVRTVGLLGAGWGVVLLTRGDRLWSLVDNRGPSHGEAVALGVLGTRHLLQGVAVAIAPRRCQGLWSFVDLTHAASMVALALLDPKRRGPAMVSAGTALACGVVTLRARRLGRVEPS